MKSPTHELFDAVRHCAQASPYVLLRFGEEGPDGRGAQCPHGCFRSVRRAVKLYATWIRTMNVPPERAVSVLRDAVRVAVPDIHPQSVLMTSAGSWLLEGYYSADHALGD